MTDISPNVVRQLMLRNRMRQIDSVESAKLVRRELLACIEENRPPMLSPAVVDDAKRAAPYGEFPSHETLLFIFADEL